MIFSRVCCAIFLVFLPHYLESQPDDDSRKDILYLIHHSECVPESELLDSDRASAISLVTGSVQLFSCPQALHLPNASLIDARNLLYLYATNLPWFKWLRYVIFVDGRVRLSHTKARKGSPRKDSNPWHTFESYLLDWQPAVGIPRSTGEDFKSELEVQTTNAISQSLVAYHLDAANVLLPYPNLYFDGSDSEYATIQSTQSMLAAAAFQKHILQFNDLMVESVPSLHSITSCPSYLVAMSWVTSATNTFERMLATPWERFDVTSQSANMQQGNIGKPPRANVSLHPLNAKDDCLPLPAPARRWDMSGLYTQAEAMVYLDHRHPYFAMQRAAARRASALNASISPGFGGFANDWPEPLLVTDTNGAEEMYCGFVKDTDALYREKLLVWLHQAAWHTRSVLFDSQMRNASALRGFHPHLELQPAMSEMDNWRRRKGFLEPSNEEITVIARWRRAKADLLAAAMPSSAGADDSGDFGLAAASVRIASNESLAQSNPDSSNQRIIFGTAEAEQQRPDGTKEAGQSAERGGYTRSFLYLVYDTVGCRDLTHLRSNESRVLRLILVEKEGTKGQDCPDTSGENELSLTYRSDAAATDLATVRNRLLHEAQQRFPEEQFLYYVFVDARATLQVAADCVTQLRSGHSFDTDPHCYKASAHTIPPEIPQLHSPASEANSSGRLKASQLRLQARREPWKLLEEYLMRWEPAVAFPRLASRSADRPRDSSSGDGGAKIGGTAPCTAYGLAGDVQAIRIGILQLVVAFHAEAAAVLLPYSLPYSWHTSNTSRSPHGGDHSANRQRNSRGKQSEQVGNVKRPWWSWQDALQDVLSAALYPAHTLQFNALVVEPPKLRGNPQEVVEVEPNWMQAVLHISPAFRSIETWMSIPLEGIQRCLIDLPAAAGVSLNGWADAAGCFAPTRGVARQRHKSKLSSRSEAQGSYLAIAAAAMDVCHSYFNSRHAFNDLRQAAGCPSAEENGRTWIPHSGGGRQVDDSMDTRSTEGLEQFVQQSIGLLTGMLHSQVQVVPAQSGNDEHVGGAGETAAYYADVVAHKVRGSAGRIHAGITSSGSGSDDGRLSNMQLFRKADRKRRQALKRLQRFSAAISVLQQHRPNKDNGENTCRREEAKKIQIESEQPFEEIFSPTQQDKGIRDNQHVGGESAWTKTLAARDPVFLMRARAHAMAWRRFQVYKEIVCAHCDARSAACGCSAGDYNPAFELLSKFIRRMLNAQWPLTSPFAEDVQGLPKDHASAFESYNKADRGDARVEAEEIGTNIKPPARDAAGMGQINWVVVELQGGIGNRLLQLVIGILIALATGRGLVVEAFRRAPAGRTSVADYEFDGVIPWGFPGLGDLHRAEASAAPERGYMQRSFVLDDDTLEMLLCGHVLQDLEPFQVVKVSIGDTPHLLLGNPRVGPSLREALHGRPFFFLSRFMWVAESARAGIRARFESLPVPQPWDGYRTVAEFARLLRPAGSGSDGGDESIRIIGVHTRIYFLRPFEYFDHRFDQSFDQTPQDDKTFCHGDPRGLDELAACVQSLITARDLKTSSTASHAAEGKLDIPIKQVILWATDNDVLSAGLLEKLVALPQVIVVRIVFNGDADRFDQSPETGLLDMLLLEEADELVGTTSSTFSFAAHARALIRPFYPSFRANRATACGARARSPESGLLFLGTTHDGCAVNQSTVHCRRLQPACLQRIMDAVTISTCLQNFAECSEAPAAPEGRESGEWTQAERAHHDEIDDSSSRAGSWLENDAERVDGNMIHAEYSVSSPTSAIGSKLGWAQDYLLDIDQARFTAYWQARYGRRLITDYAYPVLPACPPA